MESGLFLITSTNFEDSYHSGRNISCAKITNLTLLDCTWDWWMGLHMCYVELNHFARNNEGERTGDFSTDLSHGVNIQINKPYYVYVPCKLGLLPTSTSYIAVYLIWPFAKQEAIWDFLPDSSDPVRMPYITSLSANRTDSHVEMYMTPAKIQCNLLAQNSLPQSHCVAFTK